MFNQLDRFKLLQIFGYSLAVFLGFVVADLTIVSNRYLALPTQAPPSKPRRPPKIKAAPKSDYSVIVTRNIFNSDGIIPDPWGQKAGEEGVPVLSQLPLDLTGTIVHANPKKSVASIKLRNRNEINPYEVDDDLEGLATVIRIERKKVIIRNTSTQKLEYIEVPEESKITMGIKKAPTSDEVVQTAPGELTLSRAVIKKYTDNLQELLQQAKAVPNFVPGSEGQVDGFRVLQIDPDSIYEKLGIRPMDVIKSVNGEQLDSPAKAMELYQALKSSNQIELGVERNGREQSIRYKITD